MSINIHIDLEDQAGERIARFIIGMKDRTSLHRVIGDLARALTRGYLQEYADTHHDTAEKLGAEPTGFWEQAVERVATSANNQAATVSVFSPGIGRVAHDVDIFPTDGRKFLTIPVHPLAYGHRASEIQREMPMFFFQSKTTGDCFLALRQREKTDRPELMYLLTPEVHQKQDRTILPSDDQYEICALEGIDAYIDLLLSLKGAA